MLKVRALSILFFLFFLINPSKVFSEDITFNKKLPSEINKIDIEGPFVLNVSQSTNDDLKISGDKKFVPYIITNTESDTLYIRITSDTPVPNDTPLKLDAFLSDIENIKISGNSKVFVKDIDNEKFSINLSDSSYASINGSTKKLSVYASGKSYINTENLNISGNSSIYVDLNGNVELRLKNIVTEYIKINLNGFSSFDVSGTANFLDLSSANSGVITAKKLIVMNASLNMDDCTEADITVKSNLNANLKGASILRYSGSPKITKKLSKISIIKKVD